MTETLVFKHKSASCTFVVWGDENPGLSSLSDVHSVDKGKGHATGLLNEVIRYADEHGLTIASSAEPYGDEEGTLGLSPLIEFYKKFGFVFENLPNTFMSRYPK